MCFKFIYLAFCRLLQRQTARIVIQNWGETWAESQLSPPTAASPRVENGGAGSEKFAGPGSPNGQTKRKDYKRPKSDARARIHAAAFSKQKKQKQHQATTTSKMTTPPIWRCKERSNASKWCASESSARDGRQRHIYRWSLRSSQERGKCARERT